MSKHAGANKAGRNKIKCERYRSRGLRLSHKLSRIHKSNGPDAARAYQTAVARGEVKGIRFPRTRGPVPLWQIVANRPTVG